MKKHEIATIKGCGNTANVEIKRENIIIKMKDGDEFRITLDFHNRIKVSKSDLINGEPINVQPCVSNQITIG